MLVINVRNNYNNEPLVKNFSYDEIDTTGIDSYRCNGKSDCWIKSSNAYAGNDPCFGTYKYTDVAYTCLEPQTVVAACGEQDTINLKCTTGSIKVV